MKKTLFTLIELLVVIAIIAVLAAMLLPALNKARERAHGSDCVSKQKQISLAMLSFVDDNAGLFPFALKMRGGTSSGKYTEVMWEQFLFPYLSIKERPPVIFTCKSHRDWKEFTDTYNYYYWFASTNGSSYGYNGYYFGIDAATVTAATFVPQAQLSKVQQPAKTILTGERGSYLLVTPGKTSNKLGGWNKQQHLGGANFSFIDGHVSWHASNAAGASEINNFGQGTTEEIDAYWSIEK